MVKEDFENYHINFNLGELRIDDILEYVAYRAKNELEYYVEQPDSNDTVVALLEGVITATEHAAFEYYASTK